MKKLEQLANNYVKNFDCPECGTKEYLKFSQIGEHNMEIEYVCGCCGVISTIQTVREYNDRQKS